jgi:hypothetical protein
MSLSTVDLLARLHLAARRHGVDLRVRSAAGELADLIRLAGLAEALGLEPRREPEEGEERGRVEEERELDDSAV